MPKPHPHKNRDGSTTYRVRFRYRGKETSETFHTRLRAQTFCNDIAANGIAWAMAQREAEEADAEHEATEDLDTIAEAFLAWKAKASRTRSPRTVEDYRRDYESTIRPRLGSRPVGTITAPDVQAWVDAMREGKIVSERTGKPLGAKSICGRHALLHQILAWAAHPSRRIIAANPCASTDLPKQPKSKPKGILPAEWQAVRSMLEQMDDDATDMADFLLASGWRWSEGSALVAGAVEDYGKKRPVYVTMQQVSRRIGKSADTQIVPEGKGDASLRRLALDPDASAMVRRRCIGLAADDYVFTRAGLPWTHNAFAKLLRSAAQKAGVSKPVTPHVLRHSHVGWMIMAGASLPDIQARIGHASIKTTVDVYGGMISDVQPEALAAFADMRQVRPLERGARRALT